MRVHIFDNESDTAHADTSQDTKECEGLLMLCLFVSLQQFLLSQHYWQCVKVYDISTVHWKSQGHRDKVKNAAGKTPSSEPVSSSTDITELAVELTAMLGIPFRAASLLLKRTRWSDHP